MDRSELAELHYITEIANIESILKRGILCYTTAQKIRHKSIASEGVQNRRAKKRVPGAGKLHSYANLYVCARNPMMYLRKSQHELICVLRLSTDVLDIPGTVIADGNAATRITGFWPSPDGLRKLEKNIVFARYWVDQNSIVVEKRKRCKCAEVLVPTVVPPEYIFGAYVSCRSSLQMLRTFDTQLEVVVNPDIFFQ